MTNKFIFLVTFFLAFEAGAKEIKIVEEKGDPHIFVMTDKRTSIVGVTVLIKNLGILAEKEGQEGSVSFSMPIIQDHFKNKREQLEKRGIINLSFEIGIQNTTLTYSVPKEMLEESFSFIFGELLNIAPSLDRFRLLKQFYVNTYFTPSETDPSQYMQRLIFTLSFQNNPVLKNYLGSYDSIQRLNVDFYKDYFMPFLQKKNLVFALCGNITKEEAKAACHKALHKMKKSPLPQKQSLDLSRPDFSVEPIFVQLDKPQTHLVFALEAVPFTHKDYYAYRLLNAILGGATFTSRLWKELREEKAFVYAISSSINADTGLWIGATSTNNENVLKVIETIKKELIKLQKEGVGEKEFLAIKEQMSGELVCAFINPQSLSAFIIAAYEKGLSPKEPIDALLKKIEEVTLEDINRIAAKIDIQRMSYLLVGNPDLESQKLSEEKASDV